MTQIELRDWRGAIGVWPLSISIDTDDDQALSDCGPAVREIVKGLPARDQELRQVVAEKMIEVARDWAENPTLAASDLALALRVSEIGIDHLEKGAVVSVWFRANDDTFTDHALLAYLDASGTIEYVGLEG